MTPWTEIAPVIVFGICASAENLRVSFTYGPRQLRIGPIRNLLIVAVTTVAALLPLWVGRSLRGYVPTAVADVIAALLLVGMWRFNTWLERRSSGRPAKVLEPRRAAPTQPMNV